MQVLGVECWVLGVECVCVWCVCVYIYILVLFQLQCIRKRFCLGVGFLFFILCLVVDFGFWCLEAKLAFRSLI